VITAEYRTIRLEPDGELIWLVLDRPEVLNALSAEMLRELLDALPQVASSGARAMIVRGEGRAFCSGADLKSLTTDVDLRDPDEVLQHMQRWRDVVMGIRRLPIPSVAAVVGPAYGGGCNLALACDLVVAGTSARFCQSYVDRGVTTDLGGSYVLPRLVGWGRARRLLLTGEAIDGIQAAQMGLIAAAVDDDAVYVEARQFAVALAEKEPTVVMEMRRLLDDGTQGSLEEALDREADGVARILGTPQFNQRLEAFSRGN
jgi:2-(1,2-epoxy-1,2-dihydrophenyl)acetyl-CoA isomerase